jgi:transposase
LRRESWKSFKTEREFIQKHLEQGVKLSKVQRLLQRKGVNIPYTSLHRFATNEVDFGKKPSTIPVLDCEPGEEIQLDTGWMTHLEPDSTGKCKRFRAWIFTSVYSRHRFVYPCLHETTKTAIEACEAAWKFFGGVFRVLIPDNTKTIVQTADPLQPLINPTFQEYAQDRDFYIDPARSRSPKDKARVERCVPTVREDCFRGERLLTIVDAQNRACFWSLEEYGMRRHTSTQRLPRECFETEEKPRLLPAPTQSYDIPIYCDAKVGRDQHAQVANALYSLPFEFRDKTLRIRADSSTVRFYANGQLVKTHPRTAPGRRSTDYNDFPKEKAVYATRDCEFLLNQAKEKGEYVACFAKALLEGPLPWTRMRRVFALLGLCRRFGNERVDETCKIALAAEMHDIRRLERILDLAPQIRKPAPPESNVIPLARYLRPASQYAIPFNKDERITTEKGEES